MWKPVFPIWEREEKGAVGEHRESLISRGRGDDSICMMAFKPSQEFAIMSKKREKEAYVCFHVFDIILATFHFSHL